MNYQKIYDKLIENRRNTPPTGYFEKHHIIPKSLGGSNHKSNIVALSAREHFVAHLLLVKMQVPQSEAYYKMIKALHMMSVKSKNHKRRFSSRLYETLRKEFAMAQSISQSGIRNSQYGKPRSDETKKKISEKVSEYRKSKRLFSKPKKEPWNGIVSAETREKMAAARRGKTIPADVRKKISEALTGKTVSAETRKKISEYQQAKKKIVPVVQRNKAVDSLSTGPFNC